MKRKTILISAIILIVAIAAVFVSLNFIRNSKKPHEKIIIELTERYGYYVTGSNKVDEKTKVLDFENPNGKVLGDGSIFYSFYVYGQKYLEEERNVKGIVDNVLKTLPKKEEIEEYSQYCECLMNIYKWETIDVVIEMENEFHTVDIDKPYLFSRIWIREKK